MKKKYPYEDIEDNVLSWLFHYHFLLKNVVEFFITDLRMSLRQILCC